MFITHFKHINFKNFNYLHFPNDLSCDYSSTSLFQPISFKLSPHKSLLQDPRRVYYGDRPCNRRSKIKKCWAKNIKNMTGLKFQPISFQQIYTLSLIFPSSVTRFSGLSWTPIDNIFTFPAVFKVFACCSNFTLFSDSP